MLYRLSYCGATFPTKSRGQLRAAGDIGRAPQKNKRLSGDYQAASQRASALSWSASPSTESYQYSSQPRSGRPVKTIRLSG